MWPFDQNNQGMYQQYAQGYDTGNYNNFDQNQAFGHVQQFMQGAPFDMQQQIYQQHFNQMPYEQRVAFAQQMPPQYAMNPNDPLSMAQNFFRFGQEQPNMLNRIFSHPMLTGSALALAALIGKHMVDSHREGRYEAERYQNQQYGNYQDPQYGGYQNQRSQNAELREELREERREDQELRRELRAEEREEEREEHHHRRREEW